MTILYFDNNILITEQNALDLDSYYKVYTLPNGLVKKKERYNKRKLSTIDYYKDIDETEEQVKAFLMPLNISFSILEREFYGKYLIVRGNHYQRGQAQTFSSTRSLFDEEDLICSEEIDLDSNKPLFQHTKKYLGKYLDERSVNYCEFYYHSDGSLMCCDYNYMHDYDSESFDLQRLPWIKSTFMLSDEIYNYYLTADLLPPL